MKYTALAFSIAALAGACAIAASAPVQAGEPVPCPKRQFNGASLNGLGLNGINLNGPVLQGMRMNGIQLQGVQLQGTGVHGARAPIGACKPGVQIQGCEPGLRAVVLPTGERVPLR
jgi:uncharacterized protein YjbI with pentapeptide repeats